jgi:hypothetical protein
MANNGKNIRNTLSILLVASILFSCRNEVSAPIGFDFNQMGYNHPGLSVYKVTQTDSAHNTVRIDTVGLFCSDAIYPDNGFCISQWQFLSLANDGYCLKNKSNSFYEGTEVSDTGLMIHPARSCFRILQFCPYPFFHNESRIGSTWEWDNFEIGGQWTDESTLPFKYDKGSNETFNMYYTFKDTMTCKTVFGSLHCNNVTAISKSRYGNSYASFYLNNNYGLVNFDVSALNKINYKFDLISVVRNMDSIRFNREFAWTVEHNKKKSKDEENLKLLCQGVNLLK